jgi:exopolysaccharide biosynthesis protein
LVFSLCVLCGDALSQDFKTVHPGVEYAQVDSKVLSDPVKINLLRLDLTKVRLDVHHALDKAIGLETTSSIAKRKGAIAAINGGFFRLDLSPYSGEAAGILQRDGRLLSESFNGRTGIGINNIKERTDVEFLRLRTVAVAAFGVDSEFAFDGINRERKADEIILFTPGFDSTTLTEPSGTEIVITNCDVRDFSRWCQNAEVIENKGNSTIPVDGFIISIGKDALEKSNNILHFAKQTSVKPIDIFNILRVVLKVESFESHNRKIFEDITNGVPQLIKNGKIDITWEQEKASKSFVENRHPRTAVAKLKDGKFLMITVDGRQPGVSVGMNLRELAEYLLSLGAVDAMNLDGGGSTTMYLDGKVVNTPSDKEGERKIGDAILVTLRKPK